MYGGMSACVCICVCIHECLNTGAWGSLASDKELTNSKKTEVRPHIPKSEDTPQVNGKEGCKGVSPTPQPRPQHGHNPRLPTCFQKGLDNPPPLSPHPGP